MDFMKFDLVRRKVFKQILALNFGQIFIQKQLTHVDYILKDFKRTNFIYTYYA
jgi:hypothetical protein